MVSSAAQQYVQLIFVVVSTVNYPKWNIPRSISKHVFSEGLWSKEMTTPRNETPNSSFFLLNVRVQASRGLSLGCALLMPNTIWRVTTWIWLIWLVEAIFRRGTNQRALLRSTKENAVYSSRRRYQCGSAATEHVEALSARFFTFLWLVTYLCRFRRHFEFHAMR